MSALSVFSLIVWWRNRTDPSMNAALNPPGKWPPSFGSGLSGSNAKSSGLVTAGARAVDLIAARMRLQALSLSIIDGFLLIAWSCVCALILVALLRKSPLNYGDLSTVQQTPALEKESR